MNVRELRDALANLDSELPVTVYSDVDGMNIEVVSVQESEDDEMYFKVGSEMETEGKVVILSMAE